MFRRLAILTILAWSSPVFAQEPKLLSVQVEPNNRSLIVVTFESAIGAAGLLRSDDWEVVLFTKATSKEASVERVGITTCASTLPVHPVALLSRCPKVNNVDDKVMEVALQMLSPAATDVVEVEARWKRDGKLITGRSKQGGAASAGLGVTAAKADDSDFSFNGKLTKTRLGSTVFDADLVIGYMRAVTCQDCYVGRFGFYAQAKTKESATISPGSYLGYLVYQRELGGGGFSGPFQTPLLNVRVIGAEFDHDADQRNVLISPVVTFPIRLGCGPLGPLAPGFSVPAIAVQLGAEFVKPVISAFDQKSWRTRGLVGVSFRTGWAPEKRWLHAVSLTSSYVARFLSDPEPFKDPSHGVIDPATGKRGKPPLELGTQNRTKTETELKYNPTKWVGISVKYESGGLPPVFAIKDQTWTVGVSFALKQTSYGRYSILKP